MPRYYCDYCDTYLTHDSPSVRKQHNAGYKHKANIRDYYQQFEAQQNQSLIDQRIKEHLGQATYQQSGVPFNAMMRPHLPILPTPGMPMNPHLPINPALIPGMRPSVLPRPPPVYNPIPGAPPMMAPPGSAPFPGQFNGLPGPPPLTMSGPQRMNGAPPMYQQPPSSAPPNMDSFNLSNSQSQEGGD